MRCATLIPTLLLVTTSATGAALATAPNPGTERGRAALRQVEAHFGEADRHHGPYLTACRAVASDGRALAQAVRRRDTRGALRATLAVRSGFAACLKARQAFEAPFGALVKTETAIRARIEEGRFKLHELDELRLERDLRAIGAYIAGRTNRYSDAHKADLVARRAWADSFWAEVWLRQRGVTVPSVQAPAR